MSGSGKGLEMVDIGGKEPSYRRAVARGWIKLKRETMDAIKSGRIPKGDVLTVARVSAILAVKRTPELIPGCHPIPLTHIAFEFQMDEEGISVTCKVTSESKTGVEMEALTGVAVALLTIWDMVKEVEKDENGQYPFTSIENIKVLEKAKGGHIRHKEDLPKTLKFALVTISDSRTIETDESGRIAEEMLKTAGHEIRKRLIITNDRVEIKRTVEGLLDNDEIDVILTIGGTGLSKRDVTVEVVSEKIEKKIDGFGELFRFLSYNEIGTATMLSRAFAGVAKGKVLICLPGSKDAVELAIRELILPEIGHMIRESRR